VAERFQSRLEVQANERVVVGENDFHGFHDNLRLTKKDTAIIGTAMSSWFSSPRKGSAYEQEMDQKTGRRPFLHWYGPRSRQRSAVKMSEYTPSVFDLSRGHEMIFFGTLTRERREGKSGEGVNSSCYQTVS
jgi:hypothetical protein